MLSSTTRSLFKPRWERSKIKTQYQISSNLLSDTTLHTQPNNPSHRGSAIALMMTYYLVLIQLLAYVWGSGIYRETWNGKRRHLHNGITKFIKTQVVSGWSWRCLDGWGEFARVTTFSICMTSVLWVCTEVGTFLGGLLGTRELSAFSMSFQVEGFAWMVRQNLIRS